MREIGLVAQHCNVMKKVGGWGVGVGGWGLHFWDTLFSILWMFNSPTGSKIGGRRTGQSVSLCVPQPAQGVRLCHQGNCRRQFYRVRWLQRYNCFLVMMFDVVVGTCLIWEWKLWLPRCHARHMSHGTEEHVTRRTSDVTRHTSHFFRHTSHFFRHTSHFFRHTSHVTRHQHPHSPCFFRAISTLQ